MFYVESPSRFRASPAASSDWRHAQALRLVPILAEQVEDEILLFDPGSASWCYVTKEEYKVCQRLAGVSFDALTSLVAWSPEVLGEFLGHLVARGLVRTDQGEDQNQGYVANSLAAHAGRMFKLTLILSDRCNLACSYCYLGDGTTAKQGQMPRWVAQLALDYISEQPMENVLIDFGEISTCYPYFVDLARWVGTYARQTYKRFSLWVQTNGIGLSEDRIRFLKSSNISVGISLDGPQAINDCCRRFPNGQGTHASILRALKMLIEWDIPHMVVCTVTRNSLNAASEIIDHFRELDVQNFTFKPVVARGTATRTWSDHGISPYEYAVFAREVIDYACDQRNLDLLDQRLARMVHRIVGDVRGWTDRCPTAYCGCGTEMLTIGPNGGIYPCPRFASFQTGQCLLGTLRPHANVRAYMGSQLISQIAQRAQRGVSSCAQCRWRLLCSGGCPLEAYNYHGAFEFPDPMCSYYREIYNHILKELLRRLGRSNINVGTRLLGLRVFDKKIVGW